MSELRRVGHFRELRHGDPNGPSLTESRDRLDPSLRSRVAGYLRSGAVLAATGARVGDWFSKADGVFPLDARTDGIWLWHGDLSHYVELYGVALPTEFVEHMESRHWTPPALSEDELIAIAKSMMPRPSH